MHSTTSPQQAQHSTAQHGTAQHSTAQHSTARHSTAQHSTAQHGTSQHSTARHSTVQHGTAQYSGTAQHSTAQHSTAQHSTAQHSTAQHSTAQHSTAQHSTAQHSTAQHRACCRTRAGVLKTRRPMPEIGWKLQTNASLFNNTKQAITSIKQWKQAGSPVRSHNFECVARDTNAEITMQWSPPGLQPKTSLYSAQAYSKPPPLNPKPMSVPRSPVDCSLGSRHAVCPTGSTCYSHVTIGATYNRPAVQVYTHVQGLKLSWATQWSRALPVYSHDVSMQGLPLSLSGVRKIMTMMDWGDIGDFVSFGEVGRDQIDDASYYILVAPQNVVGSTILTNLGDMVCSPWTLSTYLPDYNAPQASQL